MSSSKILAHLRQSWYTLRDNNYYNVNNNNSIKHLSRIFQSHGSRVMICIILDCFCALWPPHFSCYQLCCFEGSATVHPLYICVSCQICLVCLCQWMSEVSQDFFSMIAAGSLSEAGLGLGDVDFDAVSAFRGGVLSYWCRALCCHQPFPGFLPLLVHSRVHAPVLPRW